MKKLNFNQNLATVSVITMVAVLSVLAVTQSVILPAQSAFAA